MSYTIPDYIMERIRRPITPDSYIVPGSTPVVAFGNARSATVATVGLNPSRGEFLSRQGVELQGKKRRLATLASLEVSNLSNASDVIIQQVLYECDQYFQNQPYWSWFSHLEQVLSCIGVSYKNGTACHLDLVQWATNPIWRTLPPSVQQALLLADTPFLQQQLLQEHIKLVLLNGRGVINAFRDVFHIHLQAIDRCVTDRKVTTEFVVGRGFGDVSIIGWSTNLQSSYGVTNALRQQIANEVAILAGQL